MHWREFLPARQYRNTRWFLRRRWLPGARKSKSYSIWDEQLEEFTKAETEQLSSILCGADFPVHGCRLASFRKTEKAHRGRGPPSKAHLDPEMLERWVKFLAQPPQVLSLSKRIGQAMIAAGGKEEDEAQGPRRRLPRNWSASGNRAKEGSRNRTRLSKRKADVKKRSRRDALPNEFETDDQFCPGM